ncbi:MAG: hypothetical protein MJ133_01830 [Lachnospiraceae bacterium]|nr:hypothetical protein [Lachnospiraceae bacterium]
MSRTSFNTDSFEDQLAIILLDVLHKKDVLANKTYQSVKNIISEKEDTIIDTYNATNTYPV